MAVPIDNYILSRDTSEADRLNVQHEYMISCQGYYLHPDIQLSATGARIADLCTGTAIFLNEVATAYSSAECHGFDISDKMFPAQADLPKNVELHVANIKQPFDKHWLEYFDVPGGWIQWIEDDRAHSVRHAAPPVAPLNAAKESLSEAKGQTRYSPPRSSYLDRFNGLLMPNERADDMTYGYMNLDTLMKDPEVGNLEQVGCDVFVIDREDDGGKLRRDWAAMGIAAVWSMLKSREEVGNKLTDLSRDNLAKGFMEDIAEGGHFITRASVFTGRKKA